MPKRINKPLPSPYRDIFKETEELEELNCADIESKEESGNTSASSEESVPCRQNIAAAVIFILLASAFSKEG